MGIITRFWFAPLPPAPEDASIMTVTWAAGALDPDRFAGVVAGYGQFCGAYGDPGAGFEGLFGLLHLNRAQGGPQVALTAQNVLADDGLAALLAAVTPATAPAPAVEVRTLPWLYATQTLNGSGPNRRGKYKSAYMVETFPGRQIEAMWDALSTEGPPNSQSLLQVDTYGGAINAVGAGDTAVAQRSSIMKLQFQTYWDDPAYDDVSLGWIREFYDDMYGPYGPIPDTTMDGCYVGYPDVELLDWQDLYYKGNYPRLQHAKGVWDPLNVFNHQQSIELPGR